MLEGVRLRREGEVGGVVEEGEEVVGGVGRVTAVVVEVVLVEGMRIREQVYIRRCQRPGEG